MRGKEQAVTQGLLDGPRGGMQSKAMYAQMKKEGELVDGFVSGCPRPGWVTKGIKVSTLLLRFVFTLNRLRTLSLRSRYILNRTRSQNLAA
mmetsp:Transcript_37098/g.55260  ORF Transcript_37098/g.55260 Transcript_37098/m.55260 type:complete len:91 (+) Transcript_37098:888-1160(+)